MISPRCKAVLYSPWKKSFAAMRRCVVTMVALVASAAAGQQAAGSLFASEPPMVPMLRTCWSAMPCARSHRPGANSRTRGDAAIAACVAIALKQLASSLKISRLLIAQASRHHAHAAASRILVRPSQIAATMPSYPVQRQILPISASRTACGCAGTPSVCIASARMMSPGVQ